MTAKSRQDEQLANSNTILSPDPDFESIFDNIIFLNLRFEFNFRIRNSSPPNFQSHFIIHIFQNSKIKLHLTFIQFQI